MEMDALQILGYAASIVIFISLTMKSLVKLRIINAVGSLLFVVFALKTNSLPTVALNAGLVIINMYYFFRMMRSKDEFDILEIEKSNEIFTRFCKKHGQELDALFGAAAFDKCTKVAVYFRNDDVAGVVGYARAFDGKQHTAVLPVDFVVAKYRDFAIARHFFIDDLDFWRNQGIDCLQIDSPASARIPYLKRIGFAPAGNGTLWQKDIRNGGTAAKR